MKNLIISCICLLFMSSCSSDITSSADDKTSGKRTGKEIVYINSFESVSDTAGWTGIIPEMFVDGSSPGGGLKSLYIGGGCIQPAGSFQIKTLEAGIYSIGFWGKTPDTGGILSIILSDKDKQAVKDIPLTSKNWEYHILDNLCFSENTILTVELNVGGFVFASANIDLLVIKKTD